MRAPVFGVSLVPMLADSVVSHALSPRAAQIDLVAVQPADGILEILERYQTGVGIFAGLVTILIGALYNAHLIRVRDDRARRHDAIALSRALAAEISVIGQIAIGRRYFIEKVLEKKQSLSVGSMRQLSLPDVPIYLNNTSKLGLLRDDLVANTVTLHMAMDDTRRSLAIISIDATAESVEAEFPGVAAFFKSVATKAPDLVARLEQHAEELEKVNLSWRRRLVRRLSSRRSHGHDEPRPKSGRV